MRLKPTLAAAALLLLAFGASAFARQQQQQQQDGFPWGEYRTRTFAEVIKENNADAARADARNNGKVGVIFSGDPLYSQVRVTYTGTTRKVAGARKTHLEEWAKSFEVKPEVLALFDTEMLVSECGVEHWVPVQKQMLPHFERELKRGDMVTLYTMFAGGRKIEGSWNWFFLVNEFQAYH